MVDIERKLETNHKKAANGTVSVITVCYNAENSIRMTLENVINQKLYCNLEYIVIDGASKDKTNDIIHEYISEIDYYLSEPDNGIYDAMNKGLCQAHGQIVGFMNAGDCYKDGIIPTVISVFNEKEADVVYGNAIITEDGQEKGVRRGDPDPSHIIASMIACHQSIFFRTEMHKQHKYDTTYRITADRKLLLELFTGNYSFEFIDQIISYYDYSGISSRMIYERDLEGYRMTYDAVIHNSVLREKHLKDITRQFLMSEFRHDWEMNATGFIEGLADYVHERLERKRILIWGAGIWGRRCLEILQSIHCPVDSFIDSNAECEEIEGYKVTHPEDVLFPGDGIVIISTQKYSEEIIDALKNMKYQGGYILFQDLLIDYEEKVGKRIENTLVM